MRKTLFIFCILTLLTSQFSIPTPARASQEINECTHYVDVTGSDANDGLTRWNRLLKTSGVNFRITLPHVAFNRRIGEFNAIQTDTQGNILTNDVWEATKETMLPSADSMGKTSKKEACSPLSSRSSGAASSCIKSRKEFFCISKRCGSSIACGIVPNLICFIVCPSPRPF